MSGKWNGSRHNERRGGSGWADNRAAKRILERDGYRCYYRGPDCIGVATLVDHVVNLAVTGPAGNHDGNKNAICQPCHRAKTKLESAAGRAKRSRKRPPEPHPGLLP